MPTGLRGRALRFATWIVALCAMGGTPAQETVEQGEPFETGLVERTGITLMFLDVEITDEDGNPLPGLTADDFEVQINGRFRPIYSVDDLCGCESADDPGASASATEGSAPAPAATPGGDPAPGETTLEPVSYVLYFDYGQLQQDGRVNAAAQARRWVREIMGPQDRAKVVAYASLSGLRELCPFTRDRQVLLDAIDRGYDDPELVDSFPSLFNARVRACERCCETYPFPCSSCGRDCCAPECMGNARDEFQHGRRSLKALIALLRQLEAEPGRKSLLMFHQNSVIFPSRFYPVRDFGDHVALLDSAGAEATLSRTVVYPAFSGSVNRLEGELAGQAVSFGANLADFTGGKYNRGNTDMSALIDETVQGCACTYRIGIRPPRDYKRRVFRIKVWARDRAVPYRYRTMFLDEVDRWWRSAQGVLADPDRAQDVALAATLVPLGGSDKGWEISIQLGLPVDSLALFPSAGKYRGDWEVGALLYREGEGRNWEMLGRSKLLVGDEVESGATVLHRRTIEGLKPGEYRLAAFVRDLAANAFGGAEARLILPRLGKGGIAGPVLLAADRLVVATPLPLVEEKADSATRSDAVTVGRVPAGGTVRAGVPLEVVSWVCADSPDADDPDPVRFVSREGTPLFRFEPGEQEPAASCRRVTDRIETGALEPGAYTYHLRWSGSLDEDAADEEIDFLVVPAEKSGRGDEE